MHSSAAMPVLPLPSTYRAPGVVVPPPAPVVRKVAALPGPLSRPEASRTDTVTVYEVLGWRL